MHKQIGKIIKINGIFYNAANIWAVSPVFSANPQAKIICPICGNEMTYLKESQLVNCRKCNRQINVEEGLEFYFIVLTNGLIITMKYQKLTEVRKSQKNLLIQWAISISPPELLREKVKSRGKND